MSQPLPSLHNWRPPESNLIYHDITFLHATQTSMTEQGKFVVWQEARETTIEYKPDQVENANPHANVSMQYASVARKIMLRRFRLRGECNVRCHSG